MSLWRDLWVTDLLLLLLGVSAGCSFDRLDSRHGVLCVLMRALCVVLVSLWRGVGGNGVGVSDLLGVSAGLDRLDSQRELHVSAVLITITVLATPRATGQPGRRL